MITDEYAAGFFDGEGSVYAATRGKDRPKWHLTVMVCISNTHEGVLRQFQERWGGSLLPRSKVKERHRQQWQWVIPSRKANAFLRAIAPHVIIKKDVVDTALELIDILGRPVSERVIYGDKVFRRGRYWSSPKPAPGHEESVVSLHGKIRELNKRGAPFNARRAS